MLFLRISGSFLLLVSAALTARYLNRKAEGELLELDTILALIRQIRLEVESFSLPISKILERIEEKQLLAFGYKKDAPPTSLEELCSEINFKNEHSGELFSRFCADFGSGYRDEELRRLSYYEELFSRERERVSVALPSKKKVNTTISISLAIGIVILMI